MLVVSLGILGAARIMLWVALPSKREQTTHSMIKNPLTEFPNLHISPTLGVCCKK